MVFNDFGPFGGLVRLKSKKISIFDKNPYRPGEATLSENPQFLYVFLDPRPEFWGPKPAPKGPQIDPILDAKKAKIVKIAFFTFLHNFGTPAPSKGPLSVS